MPRQGRIVIPNVPHHVTHRGNNSKGIFRSPDDMWAYLSMLKRQSMRFKVEIIAFCLMDNHVHLVVVPRDEDSLANAIGKAHGHYAQHINRARRSTGHLWEDRFFSCAMDEDYFLQATRYVERNPVRAGIVPHPWDYPWSSAMAHIRDHDETGVLNMRWWREVVGQEDWANFIEQSDVPDAIDSIRSNTHLGTPLGDKNYFEGITGHPVSW
jgi:putative transposase